MTEYIPDRPRPEILDILAHHADLDRDEDDFLVSSPLIDNSALAGIIVRFYQSPGATLTDDVGNNITLDDAMETVSEMILENMARGMIGTNAADQATINVVNLISAITGIPVEESSAGFFRHLFINAIHAQTGTPRPSDNVTFTIKDDILTPSNELQMLTKNRGSEMAHQSLAMGISAMFDPSSLGLFFRNTSDFERLCKEFSAYGQDLFDNKVIDQATLDQINSLRDIRYRRATTGVALRRRLSSTTEPNSFQRVIVKFIIEYTAKQADFAAKNDRPCPLLVVPFAFANWVTPDNITFYNIEYIAAATPSDIRHDLTSIMRQSNNSPRIISMDELTELDKLETSTRESAAVVAAARNTRLNPDFAAQRDDGGNDFTTYPLDNNTPGRVAESLAGLINAYGPRLMSQNTRNIKKKSSSKQSRRHPDDPTKFGKSIRKIHYSDLHLFVDRSSSIQDSHYAAQLNLITGIALELGIDIYYNSFSHVISEEIKLPIHDIDPGQIPDMLKVIPNVSGWTDFTQVFNYIQEREETHDRICLMITDFEWEPSEYDNMTGVPSNLFYAPSFDMTDRNSILYVEKCADTFAQAMLPYSPDIYPRMLGVYSA